MGQFDNDNDLEGDPTMDHELYEPLDAFDADQRELMIGVITEKVRRILSLDPTKFVNGKLPYGLRPDSDDAASVKRIKELEALLMKSRNEVAQAEREAENADSRVKLERKQGNSNDSVDDEGSGGAGPGKAELRDQLLQVARDKKAQEEQNEKLLAQIARLEAQCAKLNDSLVNSPGKKDCDLTAQAGDWNGWPLMSEKERSGSLGEALEFCKGMDPMQVAKKLYRTAGALDRSQAALAKLMLKLSPSMGARAEKDIGDIVEQVFGTRSLDSSPGPVQRPTAASPNGRPGTRPGTAPGLERFESYVPKALEAVDQMRGNSIGGGRKLDSSGRPVVPAAGFDSVEDEVVSLRAEVARLLLLVDELRSRVEQMKEVSEAEGAGCARAVASVLGKVGLKDLACGTDVMSVFERLYQDALERAQRLGLIQARMRLANRACSDKIQRAVTAYSMGDREKDIYQKINFADVTSGLDHLSETATAALRGMYYQPSTVFWRACEYAQHQGFETTMQQHCTRSLEDLLKREIDETDRELSTCASLREAALRHTSLGETTMSEWPRTFREFETEKKSRQLASPNATTATSLGSVAFSETLQLPIDRSASSPTLRRPLEELFGASVSASLDTLRPVVGLGRANWDTPLPGGCGGGPRSPRADRRSRLQDPEPTSFNSYVAQLRDARGDLKGDWQKLDTAFAFQKAAGKNTLRRCVGLDIDRSLEKCLSLPVLPEVRGVKQSDRRAESPAALRTM